MRLKFKNWDKYNKRQKDIKNPFWFALSNQVFLDPFFADLSDQERMTFLWLLCEASKQNKYGEVEVSERLYVQITGYKISVLTDTVSKLLKSGCAAGSRQDGGGITASTRQDKTEQETLSSKADEVTEAVEGGLKTTDLVNLWNESAHPSLARVIKLTEPRRRAISRALREYPESEFWADVIQAVNRSQFLTGQGAVSGNRSKPWRCDLDFIVRGDNAIKIIEGKYS